MKRIEREDRLLNTSDGREVRELEPRLMKKREMKGEIEDEVMVEEREMRENEGCSIHQKHQIQVKQHCCIENSKMKERSEGRNEWRRE